MELVYTSWDMVSYADDVWENATSDLRAAIDQQWQENSENTPNKNVGSDPPKWVSQTTSSITNFHYPPFAWKSDRRKEIRAQLDACYGHLYGLKREELNYILESFPIVKEKDNDQYGNFKTKDKILEYYDAYNGEFEYSGGAN
jgi:hypothetical protein